MFQPFPTIAQFIETYESIYSVLDLIESTIESGSNGDPELKQAVVHLMKARIILGQYQGKVLED
jgi:hypothetical protein